MTSYTSSGSHESPDPIFRLPRPWWHHVFPCLAGLALFSLAVAAEWSLLQPETVTFRDRGGVQRTMSRIERWPNIALWGVLLVVTPLLPLSYAMTSPLVIRKHGLELGLRDRRLEPTVWYVSMSFGWLSSATRWFSMLRRWEFRITPWEQIGPCHWGRYNRGTLTIPCPDGLLFIAIPERYRAEVETALRRFDKWQD